MRYLLSVALLAYGVPALAQPSPRPAPPPADAALAAAFCENWHAVAGAAVELAQYEIEAALKGHVTISESMALWMSILVPVLTHIPCTRAEPATAAGTGPASMHGDTATPAEPRAAEQPKRGVITQDPAASTHQSLPMSSPGATPGDERAALYSQYQQLIERARRDASRTQPPETRPE